MKRQLILLLGLCLTTLNICQAQDYLQLGNDCFDKGDYECAKKYYAAQKEVSTSTGMDEKIKDCDKCVNILAVADFLFSDREYQKANAKYEELLTLNPKDAHARSRSEICRSNIISSPTKNRPKKFRPRKYRSYDLWKGRSYNAWGLIGFDYPWNIHTGMYGRSGGIVGIGYAAYIGIEDLNYFSYMVSLRFFPFKNFYLSAGYGTIGLHDVNQFNYDDGRFRWDGRKQAKGLLFTGGYDILVEDIGLLSFGGGIGYDTFMKEKYYPVINITLGFQLGKNY